jgi:hypothetical protein
VLGGESVERRAHTAPPRRVDVAPPAAHGARWPRTWSRCAAQRVEQRREEAVVVDPAPAPRRTRAGPRVTSDW